jgi:hypothetical protein
MLHRISMNVPQRVVSAVQTGRHDKPMLQAASHPPSHKTRGQGTHFSGTGEENQRPGHPPKARVGKLTGVAGQSALLLPEKGNQAHGRRF